MKATLVLAMSEVEFSRVMYHEVADVTFAGLLSCRVWSWLPLPLPLPQPAFLGVHGINGLGKVPSEIPTPTYL